MLASRSPPWQSRHGVRTAFYTLLHTDEKLILQLWEEVPLKTTLYFCNSLCGIMAIITNAISFYSLFVRCGVWKLGIVSVLKPGAAWVYL